MEGKLFDYKQTGLSSVYLGIGLSLLTFGFVFYSKYEFVSIAIIIIGLILIGRLIYVGFWSTPLLWKLENGNNELQLIINHGGTIHSIKAPFDYKMSFYKSHLKTQTIKTIYQYNLCFSIEPGQGIPPFTFIETFPAGKGKIPEGCLEQEAFSKTKNVFINSNGFVLKPNNLFKLDGYLNDYNKNASQQNI
jgi:hypothetical protein